MRSALAAKRAISRLDHLLLHVDDMSRAVAGFEALKMPVSIPATPYAFDGPSGEEIEFSTRQFSLGGGANVEFYSDGSIAELRRNSSLPSAAVGSLALESAALNRFRLHSLLNRMEVKHLPEPIVYHVPDRMRVQDPLLPPWLFSRVLFPHAGIGGAADAVAGGGAGASLMGGAHLDGMLVSATESVSPAMHFAFAVSWHRDFAFAPLRNRGGGLPEGSLGVVACPRVLVTCESDETELSRVMGFWDALGQTIIQPARGEVEVVFANGGPALRVVSTSNSAGNLLRGTERWSDAGPELWERHGAEAALNGGPPHRVWGWEWRVLVPMDEAARTLESVGLSVLRQAADEVVVDLTGWGMHGMRMMVSPATSVDLQQCDAAVSRLRAVSNAAVAGAMLLDSEGRHTRLLQVPMLER
jgi:hypothetical protein